MTAYSPAQLKRHLKQQGLAVDFAPPILRTVPAGHVGRGQRVWGYQDAGSSPHAGHVACRAGMGGPGTKFVLSPAA